MIKVETILDGSYTEQNKKDLAELKNFVYASPKFKKYHENILKIEENKKLTIIDKEIKKLENIVKVTSGSNDEAAEFIDDLYNSINGRIIVTSLIMFFSFSH